ncbi:hypothetical protein D8674_019042 [Pyrus ussuriensis x Pyrus communis]|uniref:Myb/SANT-like domain-containing protein n=1 Tax=Pyrus ussuriensis x Pyrus communis TaxID=2448454 RepID=A0A5N5GBV8_9ROSA|nr:hypothetical protein D8674_019042 [Pyrus ussuriensis x Pyrus communis]
MEGFDRKPVCKQKPRKKKENQEIENEGDESNYFRWNVDMERALVNIFREEQRLGNKGDGGWNTAAYNSVAFILSAQFDIHVTANNIQNHVKSWKKLYAIVSDILNQSGYSWDATKKMISADKDHVWQEYVKDDIVDLCGKDRATGEGAEIGVEAIEIMTPPHNETNHIDLDSDTQGLEDIEIINDISPTSAIGQKAHSKRKPTNFVDVPRTKKKPTTPKDTIADSLAKMASSFQDYICADTKKLDRTEVYDEVNAIPDLSEEEQIKVCAWLIKNDKQYLMLKTLLVEKKNNMVLLFTS